MGIVKRYVPILRWKGSEKDALLKLRPLERNAITPLIEFVMPNPKMNKERSIILKDSRAVLVDSLPSVAQDILRCWGKEPVFIDVHLIDEDLKSKALSAILHSCNGLGIEAIPIICSATIDESRELRTVAVAFSKISHNGACFRLGRKDIKNGNLENSIVGFINRNGLDVGSLDVLVDLGIVNDKDDPVLIANDLSHLPMLKDWRSFILSGGAHPKDLTLLRKHERHQLPRHDWMLWKGIAGQLTLVRRPIFSDYTIQYPIYESKYIPGMNISASIRYTSDDTWEILRGEGLKNPKGDKYVQYIAWARLLIEQDFYKGCAYSFGDEYVNDKAAPDNIKTGSVQTWLCAGINHHLVLSGKQSANPVS